jgi:hypothetical protein
VVCTFFTACADGLDRDADFPGDVALDGRQQELTGYWETESSRCGVSSYVPTVKRTVRVSTSGDLQAAIDAATPGTEIVLSANATYRGNFILRNKRTSSSYYITIRSSAPRNSGIRVTPGDRASLARVYAKNDQPVFRAEPGAHHYYLANLEIAAPGYYTKTLVELGSGNETQAAQLPHHIRLDRLYIKGDASLGGKRGVALNGKSLWVQNSWISNFKSLSQDSQALAGWNGAGEFVIANNYLEAAGENLLIGGTDPRIPDLVPTDIRIKFNHFSKQLSWRIGDPSYAGKPWVVKNLLELKNARDVVIEGNLFEHNWPHAQNGFAVLFTVRNQDGNAPWSRVADVTFRRNVVRKVAAAISILGHDDVYRSQGTSDITIEHNLFTEVGGAWGGGSSTSGRMFQLYSGTSDPGPSNVRIDHNTARNTPGHYLLGVGGSTPKPGFVFTNQIVDHAAGVYGDGMSTTQALEANFPDAIFTANALVGASSSTYSAYPGNYFPSSETAVRFKGGGDYELASTSTYNNKGTDGRDLGVNFWYLDLASQCH